MRRYSGLFLALALGISTAAACAQSAAAPASGSSAAATTPTAAPAAPCVVAPTPVTIPAPAVPQITPGAALSAIPASGSAEAVNAGAALIANMGTRAGQNINPPVPVLTGPLTMDDALALAFENSPSIRIALDVLQRAKGVVAEARAGFNPKITGQISYVRQPTSTVTIPSQPGQPAQTVTITPAQNTIFGANFLLPLDINKRISFATQIAQYQFQIQYLNLVAASERLIFNVKSAYYNLLRACGQEQVAAAAVTDSEVQLKDARAKFAAGVAARFDVTRAEVQVANNNQVLIQARRAVSVAQATLNQTLGIDVNVPSTLAGAPVTPCITTVDVPKAVDVAYANRPDVKAAQTAITSNQTNVRLQRTGYYPTLSINGNTTFQTTSGGFSSSNANWNASAVLSFPIWDGGVTRARIQQARADMLNSENTVDQTKLGVSLEVRTAALNLIEAADRIKSTAQNVALAEESLRLANVRYTAGISPLVEVTDAQSALTQARFNNVQAQYDYATALADYERATATQPETQRLRILDSDLVCFG